MSVRKPFLNPSRTRPYSWWILRTVADRLLVWLTAISVLALPAAASSDVNLVVNGGFENATLLVDNGDLSGPAEFDGWTRFGNVFRNLYGTYDRTVFSQEGAYLGNGSSLFNLFGQGYLLGGDEEVTAVSQIIDISAYSATTDSGRLQYKMNGWLGGDSAGGDGDDFSVVLASFVAESPTDGDGKLVPPSLVEPRFPGPESDSLGSTLLEPLSLAERDRSLWVQNNRQRIPPITGVGKYREILGLAPVGTQYVRLDIWMFRDPTLGVINHGSVDELSFSVSIIPEPNTLLLVLMAASVGFKRRPKRP